MSSYSVGIDQIKPRERHGWQEGLIALGLIATLGLAITGQLNYRPITQANAQEAYTSPSAALKIVDRYDVNRELTPVEQQDWDGMQLMARRMAPIYHYPVKVVIAQMALESGRGTSHYCVTRNNCFGIAAYDDNPDAAWSFETKEQGMIEYFRLIRDNFKEAWASRSNPDRMIELLEHNAAGIQYATDPGYVTKLRSLPEWRNN